MLKNYLNIDRIDLYDDTEYLNNDNLLLLNHILRKENYDSNELIKVSFSELNNIRFKK